MIECGGCGLMTFALEGSAFAKKKRLERLGMHSFVVGLLFR